jgi:hypothetical protein
MKNTSYTQVIATMQKQAIRTLAKAKYNDHTLPLFKQFEILQFSYLFDMQLNMFMYNYNVSFSIKFLPGIPK